MKILVVTTKENLVWESMQEVIPEIEQALSTLSVFGHQVTILNLADKNIKSFAREIIEADEIIFSAFNYTIGSLAKKIRETIAPDTRFTLYLHGISTLGCWPLMEYQMANVMRKSDIFISSSTKDADTFNLLNTGAVSAVVPHSLNQLNKGTFDISFEINPFDFVYVGRISEQKNLHTLILSFSLFRKKSNAGILHIFGKEDFLGSPNMGKKSGQYLEFLQQLVVDLKLQNIIRFHGHVQRDALYENLSKFPHIFISASLHSDENFGMAALRSLSLGNAAVLTNWGGHHDFLKAFSDRTYAVSVYGKENGPFVDAGELATSMHTAYTARLFNKILTPSQTYDRKSIAKKLLNLLEEIKPSSNETINTTGISKVLESRRYYAQEDPMSTRIFKDYSDPMAKSFFCAYGMIDLPRIKNGKIIPWAKMVDNKVIVSDPHRGKIEVDLKTTSSHWCDEGAFYQLQ